MPRKERNTESQRARQAAHKAEQKQGKTPTPAQRAASRERARGNIAGAAAFMIGDFEQEFCSQFAATGLPVQSYHAAQIKTGTPLDLSNYQVATERDEFPNGGLRKLVQRIYTMQGEQVKEDDIRYAKACVLLGYPEIRARIADIREGLAKAVKVTAESIALELDTIAAHAMTLGQLQVAASTRQMKAKMFGIETGTGEPAVAPVTEVRINIRDCTKAKTE